MKVQRANNVPYYRKVLYYGTPRGGRCGAGLGPAAELLLGAELYANPGSAGDRTYHRVFKRVILALRGALEQSRHTGVLLPLRIVFGPAPGLTRGFSRKGAPYCQALTLTDFRIVALPCLIRVQIEYRHDPIHVPVPAVARSGRLAQHSTFTVPYWRSRAARVAERALSFGRHSALLVDYRGLIARRPATGCCALNEAFHGRHSPVTLKETMCGRTVLGLRNSHRYLFLSSPE
jgi:hypothetical protein